MIYTCAVCHRELVTRASEATDDGRFPDVVPYVAVMRDDTGAAYYCCADCQESHSGYGKFQAHRNDRNMLGKCLIVNAWQLDGSYADDYMSNEGHGYAGIFGRYILIEDTSGFVELCEFADSDKAQAEFDDWYADGMGAQEDDAYIQDDWQRGYYVSFNGKPLDVPANRNGELSYRRCLAAVRLEMLRTGYYPNVWHVDERGGLTLVKNV